MPVSQRPPGMSQDEWKKLRRKARREARKANAGTPIAGVRRETSTFVRGPIDTSNIEEYRDGIIKILELPIMEEAGNDWWIGFSVSYMRHLYPDPNHAAGAILEALERDGVEPTHCAIFAGGILGVGPVITGDPMVKSTRDEEAEDADTDTPDPADDGWGDEAEGEADEA